MDKYSERTSLPQQQFLAVVHRTSTGFSGSFPNVPGVVATGKDEPQLLKHLAEVLALQFDGDEQPPPSITSTVDDLEQDEFTRWIEPAPMNPVSQEIAEALAATGRSLRQLAPELGMNYTALSRLQDPFYWGHSLASLRQLATGLGLVLELKLRKST